jgi:pimeloyl-ACP methyl ester carboxylesterase
MISKSASQKPDSQLNAALGTVSDGHLSCDGLRIAFGHAGLGPAVVLVHGLLGYSFSWRNVIPILARGRQVFAPDMPGAGFSECRADLDCRLISAAKRLLSFLDAAGIHSCDLVGSSYGGATAVMLAGLVPERVRTLVLVSPANPWSKIGRKRLRFLRYSGVRQVFPKAARAARPLHEYFVRRMWGNPAQVTAETLHGYSRPLVQPGIFEHSVKIVQTWDSDMAEFKAVLPKLARIPSLLIWGSRDRVVDPFSAESIARNLPDSQIAVMEGAGHLPYEECPEEFSRIVQGFMDRHSFGMGATRKVT